MPSHGALANRRLLLYLLAAAGILSFLILSLQSHHSSSSSSSPLAYANTPIHHVTVDQDTLAGGAIMPKLGNETLKAELGRAAWKLFHTTMARFPEKPTEDERTALFGYIHLFARLYPCGECAGHFRQILTKNPPQVSSRNVAAGWACHVHNKVNKSLEKPLFDCNNIGDFYDCGCAHDPDEEQEERKGGEKGEGGDKREGGEKRKDGKEADAATAKKTSKPELRVEREPEQLGG